MNKNVHKGQIVKSISGRDKGRYFIVIKICPDDMVLISDGTLRKIQKPKLKKIKHLELTTSLCDAVDQINYDDLQSQNAFIRRQLEILGYSNKRGE